MMQPRYFMQMLERFQIEIGMRILSFPQSKLFALG